MIDRIHVQGIHIGFSHSHESPKAQRQRHGTVHLSWKENTYGSSQLKKKCHGEEKQFIKISHSCNEGVNL